MQLGFENKKKAMWAAVLGGLAVVALLFEIVPLFFGGSPAPVAASQPVAATTTKTSSTRRGAANKKPKVENLDPTLQLQLLAAVEQTQYSGSGRNIFASTPEPLPQAVANAATDQAKAAEAAKVYTPPPTPPPPPIPLKFFGFASRPGEPKKIFLSQGEDVFVAGEGEIVDRRYKVIHITPTSVEMQDVVFSGPSQTIPLTQG